MASLRLGSERGEFCGRQSLLLRQRMQVWKLEFAGAGFVER
jgi:hypothetical protein